MLFKNVLLAPLLSGLAAAAPATTSSASAPSTNPSTFQIMALRSASDIHFAIASAYKSSIFLRLPKQHASCDKKSDGYATFSLTEEGELYLYSTDNPPQKLYADRSGMGQGKLGYITGAQPPPRNAEVKGWELDESGNLSLDGASLIACPNSIDDAWSVWVSSGVDNPAGNKDCLGFSARAVEAKEPNSCTYVE